MAEMPGFSPPTRGVIPSEQVDPKEFYSFPRPCGGDPGKHISGKRFSAFSPPTRG